MRLKILQVCDIPKVFGYDLIEIESNKYILVNEIENNLPHLIFQDNHKHVLLYLILVHIFMYGESCKEGNFYFLDLHVICYI